NAARSCMRSRLDRSKFDTYYLPPTDLYQVSFAVIGGSSSSFLGQEGTQTRPCSPGTITDFPQFPSFHQPHGVIWTFNPARPRTVCRASAKPSRPKVWLTMTPVSTAPEASMRNAAGKVWSTAIEPTIEISSL
ncbi:MAG: hypothetical protein QOH57_3425, partial [Mycobacterium sp.]|nr:hypothetical protein [Mycobacterium sp.]